MTWTYRYAGAAALAVMLLAPGARASEGGGNSCPWAQDVTVDLGERRSITIPQSVFDPKTQNPEVDGYELRPSVDTLTLTIIGPRGEEWRAALTHIAGGKRCKAFYVGRAERVNDEDSGPVAEW